MRSFSLSELNRRPGEIADHARVAPVFLTKRNRPSLVMLSIEDYEELTRQGTSRRAETSPAGIKGRRPSKFGVLSEVAVEDSVPE